MFAISDQPDTPKLPYWLSVLIAIDQLGKAFAGDRLEKLSQEKHDGPASNCACRLSMI